MRRVELSGITALVVMLFVLFIRQNDVDHAGQYSLQRLSRHHLVFSTMR